MAAGNDNVGKPQDNAAEQAKLHEKTTLAHDDLLSGESLPLPGATGAATEAASDAREVAASAGGMALRVEDVLALGDASQGAGAFLTFDSHSVPGNTVVRVVLDGSDAQHAIELATVKGVFADINSLLGSFGPDGTPTT